MVVGMRWEVAIALTGALVLITGIMVLSRIFVEWQKYHFNTASIVSLAVAIISWLCFAASYACTIWRGQQTLHLQQAKDANLLKIVVLEVFMVPAALWLTKASSLIGIYSLSDRITKNQLIQLHILVSFFVISYLVVAFTQIFICRPFRRQWSLNPEDFCSPFIHNQEQITFTTLDLACTILFTIFCFRTFPPVYMPSWDRRCAHFLIGTSVVGCVAAISRITVLSSDSFLSNSSESLNLVAFLSCAEIAMNIITVSWPTGRGIAESTLFSFDASMGLSGSSDFAKDTRRRFGYDPPKGGRVKGGMNGQGLEFCTTTMSSGDTYDGMKRYNITRVRTPEEQARIMRNVGDNIDVQSLSIPQHIP